MRYTLVACARRGVLLLAGAAFVACSGASIATVADAGRSRDGAGGGLDAAYDVGAGDRVVPADGSPVIDAAAAADAAAGDAAAADGAGGDAPVVPPGEVLLFDGDHLKFTVADNGFHPLIRPGDPLPLANWLSPSDYYHGEFQIRYVIEGPATQQAGRLQTCIWTMGDGDGDGRNYFPESCSSQVSHDGVGDYYNTALVPAGWWKNEGVPLDFTHPEWFLIRVVLRGTSGCNVTTYDVSGACWDDEWPTFEDMEFRVTIVMVSSGGTFSGWSSYP